MLPEGKALGEAMPEPAYPIQELSPEPIDADPADVDDQIRNVIEAHLNPEKRTAETGAEIVEDETSAAAGVDTQPVSWKPQGDNANLKWKRVRLDDTPTVHVDRDEEPVPGAAGSVQNENAVVLYGTKRILTDKVKKRLLDR